jgi:hypothetical protein
MRHDQRRQYLTRNGILNLLSDEEVAIVSRAETAAPLMDGDDYLDLNHLEHGVRRARGEATGRVLPQKAVPEATWTSLVDQLAALESAAQNSRA